MPPELHSTEPSPRGFPLPRAPKGARITPSTLIDNTAKYRAQDEAKLRSKTLNLSCSVRLNRLIYQQ